MIYSAMVTFEDRMGGERSFDVIFESPDVKSAVDAIWRWGRAREAALPEVIGNIWAIKLNRYIICTVDDFGDCKSGHTFSIFDWKFDRFGAVEGENPFK